MGRGSGSFFVTTTLVGALLFIVLVLQTSGATRLRQRGPTDSPRGGGSINEARVFALRDRQEGGRRGRRTTTTTTIAPVDAGSVGGAATLTSSFSTSSPHSSLSSLLSDVAEPAALLAPDDQTWFVASTSPSSNFSFTIRNTSELTPTEIVVKPQAKVVLPCELGGNYSKLLPITHGINMSRSYRTPPAKWLHNEKPVDMITIDTRTELSGTGHRYIGDSSTAALHIDSARLEDDGIWRCIIEHEHGELLSGRTVKLFILEAPRGTYLLIDGRRLDPGNQFVPVKEGSELTLECAAEGGNPRSVLSWGMTLSQTTIEGPEQLPDNLTIVSPSPGGHSGAHLKVQRGHHNATIICIARHVTLAVPMNASILLDVQYTPSFAITRFPGFGAPIFEGIPVSLKCEVDSNPFSAPIWQRDNSAPPVEQTDDGWLNFTKISRNDSGWYKCYTKHTLGLFTSAGYFLFVRVPANSNSEMEAEALNGEATDSRKMEVQIGGAVTLECEGGCWGHGTAMDPSGPGPLALDRVIYQDAGEYRCVTPDKNSQNTWRAQLPYYIKVTGRPMVYPTAQFVSANEGESLDIAVEFCAEPSYNKLLWLSAESVYVPGGEERDGVQALELESGGIETCFRTTLRIDAVQWSHSGEWMFIVRSQAGVADASVSVNVTRAFGFSRGSTLARSVMTIFYCLIVVFYSQQR